MLDGQAGADACGGRSSRQPHRFPVGPRQSQRPPAPQRSQPRPERTLALASVQGRNHRARRGRRRRSTPGVTVVPACGGTRERRAPPRCHQAGGAKPTHHDLTLRAPRDSTGRPGTESVYPPIVDARHQPAARDTGGNQATVDGCLLGTRDVLGAGVAVAVTALVAIVGMVASGGHLGVPFQPGVRRPRSSLGCTDCGRRPLHAGSERLPHMGAVAARRTRAFSGWVRRHGDRRRRRRVGDSVAGRACQSHRTPLLDRGRGSAAGPAGQRPHLWGHGGHHPIRSPPLRGSSECRDGRRYSRLGEVSVVDRSRSRTPHRTRPRATGRASQRKVSGSPTSAKRP